MKPYTSKDAYKDFEKAKPEEKQEYFNRYADLCKYQGDCEREIKEMLVENFGFRKGVDTLIIKD